MTPRPPAGGSPGAASPDLPARSWTIPGATRPLICGHRGAPALVPENTVAGFELAAERGASWIEFDTRPTADGQLVIHHDAETTEGVTIATSPRSALRNDIPSFGEVAAAVPSLGFDIEIKVEDIVMSVSDYVDLVLAEIAEHRPSPENIVVTSFSSDALKLVRERRPDLPTGLLLWNRTVDWMFETAMTDGHVAIGPNIRRLDDQIVAEARSKGLDVFAWTVNTPAQVRKSVDLGVDLIIGDDPAVIIENL